ncbi:MAG: hypothetical protein HC817_14425 [Saprospiraceae bacterium]|nr:hypothetical protein [Saprospiraceae bacterium]
MHELYNSEQTNRANHVMKVLTIVSAIFIPLTFIVGVYGTNFDILPAAASPARLFFYVGYNDCYCHFATSLFQTKKMALKLETLSVSD